MTTTLLTTKLYVPPVLPAFVPRPRLTERLSVGMAGKLTLITAPAGFGKTTAVSAWLDPQAEAGAGHPFVLHPERVVWVSLDTADNDPVRFWSYVISALEPLAPKVAAISLALHESPQPPIEAILTTLINVLSGLSHETVLVLDDYHVISTPQIHHAVQFFLEHLPPRLHLLIMSRSAPPLPLARLRVRGQLTELGAVDLRFTPDEAARFLIEVMQLPLSAAEIAMLEARTEGWITGLHLAALAMRSRGDCAGFIRAFTGSHRFVLEYLTEEVLARQPGHVQTFLLRTSILDRMCGSLCDAVLGLEARDLRFGEARSPQASSLKPQVSQAYSQIILAELERSNLFIVPLDQEQCWYRYHPLFAEVLRHRLGNGATPQEVATLHRRASGWFERQGLVPEAVQHALAAEDSLSPRPAPARTQGLFEPLTERELEVLRLVAAGTSNRAIAAQLVVTLGTVKKHLNNIFGKLHVESRTQALARAREFGLL